jgi:hypothetical protein
MPRQPLFSAVSESRSLIRIPLPLSAGTSPQQLYVGGVCQWLERYRAQEDACGQ